MLLIDKKFVDILVDNFGSSRTFTREMVVNVALACFLHVYVCVCVCVFTAGLYI